MNATNPGYLLFCDKGRRFFKHSFSGLLACSSLSVNDLHSQPPCCIKKVASLCFFSFFSCFGLVLLYLGRVVGRRPPFFLRHVCGDLRCVAPVACMSAWHVVGFACARIWWVVGCPCPFFSSFRLSLAALSLSLFLSLSLSLSCLSHLKPTE